MKTKNPNYPVIIAKTAQTLDGKIAAAGGHSKWVTSGDVRAFARKKRNQFDAIVVGINTVLADNPELTPAHPRKRLKKIVLDSRLRIPVTARLFQKARPEDCYILTTKKADRRKMEQLKKKGVHVLVGPVSGGHVSLRWARKMFILLKFKKVLLEGGAKLIGAALKERMVDAMHIYIAPKIAGDQNALSSVQGLKLNNMNKTVQLKNLRAQTIKNHLFIQADVYRNR